MDKLNQKTDGESVNIVGHNIETIKKLFPEVFTEEKN